MEKDGLIELPTPRTTNANGKPYRRRTAAAEPELFPVADLLKNMADLSLNPVKNRKESHLWNEYIDRYHYLGYNPLPGAQLRYFARSRGQVLALLGFSAAAWKIAPRDLFIGWSKEQRQHNLLL